MDCGLSYTKISLHQSLPLTVKTLLSSSTCFAFNSSLFKSSSVSCKRSLFVVASGSSSKCEFGGLNAPLKPTTPAGRLLSTVLMNDSKYFHVAVQKQLEKLAYERDEAFARMNLSLGSHEAFLHRCYHVKRRIQLDRLGQQMLEPGAKLAQMKTQLTTKLVKEFGDIYMNLNRIKFLLQLVIVLNVKSVVTDNFLIDMDQFVAIISKVGVEDTIIAN